MKFMVINEVLDCATLAERRDVTLGKPYEIKGTKGSEYFIDDAGDHNSGAQVNNTVYVFDIYKKKKVKCKCS